MSAEGNLGVLPIHLIHDIFLRLSSKSIAICRCVSKPWASLLRSPNFTELFLTQSVTRPRLLFTVRRENSEWCLYSCPQPQISDKNPDSSLSITAEFHMSLLTYRISEMSPSISGLIYSQINQVLYNPSTRHILRLPRPSSSVTRCFLGYDPIDKQFSVLAFCRSLDSALPLNCQILKLGGETLSWRSLKSHLDYYPSKTSICIDGILYYCCGNKITCFDLNSEEFKFIDEPWPHWPNLLVNFKGKLGGIIANWEDWEDWDDLDENEYELELSLWVLEDVEKQEWSQHVYHLPYNLPPTELWHKDLQPYRILGLTGKGDIVLALPYTTDPFYVCFFNLEKNSLQKVEIKGFEGLCKRNDVQGCDFSACVDYVEELRVLS